MLKTNRVKEKLRNGGICYGTMLRLVKDPGIIPLCASAGWDFVIFDTEHYDCDTETLSALALTAKYEEMTFLVRVPDKFYHQMARVLDIGAEGLILPRVENHEVAEQIIEDRIGDGITDLIGMTFGNGLRCKKMNASLAHCFLLSGNCR